MVLVNDTRLPYATGLAYATLIHQFMIPSIPWGPSLCFTRGRLEEWAGRIRTSQDFFL